MIQSHVLRRLCVLLLTLLSSAAAHAVCPDFGLPSGSEIVELQTTRGQICIELLRADAPKTVLNFYGYVDRGDYDGTIIHRSVPGFVVQGGAFKVTTDSLTVQPTQPPVVNEPCTIPSGNTVCTDRGNVRGTIAMARIGGQVNSATNQYFINLADNRVSLDTTDQGFTVFGNILGTTMSVADDIAGLSRVPTDEAWWLAPAIGGVLTQLPFANAVPFLPTAFGCFDPTDLAVHVDPNNHTLGLPDPVFGTPFYPLSGPCGTQIPRFTFTENPGPPSCPANDILTTGVTGMNSLGIRIDPATQDFLQFEFTCQDAAESLNQRGLWRADYGSRLVPELVVVTSATYQPVPEPGLGVMLIAGVVWLARRRGASRA